MDKVTTEGNNVIGFKRPEPQRPAEAVVDDQPVERLAFICGSCECRTFNLFDDGTIQCAYCEQVLCSCEGGAEQQGSWRRCLPPVPEDRSQLDDEAGTVNVNHLQDTSLARRHVVKALNDWNKGGDLAMIVGYNTNGASHGWFGIETEEQRGWMLDKLNDIRNHVAGMHIEEDMENVIKGKPDGVD